MLSLAARLVEKISIKENDTVYTESNPLALSAVPGEPVDVEAEMMMLTGLADTYEREGDSAEKKLSISEIIQTEKERQSCTSTHR